MKKLVSVRNMIVIVPVLLLAAALSYGLPQVDVVRAVGVEIKRLDTSDSATGQQRTRDVYYLQMETPEGQPRVYRNDDNFLYLKFDSANLQTQIQSLSDGKQLVALRHYGIRLPIFSMFPNAVKVWPVEEGYRHIPVFNTLVFLMLGAIALLGMRRLRRLSDQRAQSRAAREAEQAERAAAAERAAQAAAEQARARERKQSAEIDDFLGTDGTKKD